MPYFAAYSQQVREGLQFAYSNSRLQKKSSATPHNGEVVGSESLVPLWRSATAWSTPGWLGGLWGGLLDSGDSAGWLSDPLRPSTSSIRAASLSLLAYLRQPIKVVALIQDLQTPLRKGTVEPAPQSPGFYNSLFLIQKASWSWHPIIDLSPRLFLHGDSIVSPSSHSPRRLDGLSGSTGRLPAGSSHHYSRRYLRFVVGKRTYQFGVLCFGLTPSHQVFMRIMIPISAILHKYGRLTHSGLFRTRH